MYAEVYKFFSDISGRGLRDQPLGLLVRLEPLAELKESSRNDRDDLDAHKAADAALRDSREGALRTAVAEAQATAVEANASRKHLPALLPSTADRVTRYVQGPMTRAWHAPAAAPTANAASAVSAMDGAVCRRNWCAVCRAPSNTAPLHEPSTTLAPVPLQNAFRPP